jgi:hypothetical protein
VNRALADRATARNLFLVQAQFVALAQHFFDLSHGQPLFWQLNSFHLQWKAHRLSVVQRRSERFNQISMPFRFHAN